MEEEEPAVQEAPSPCIVCGTQPEPAFSHKPTMQPWGATMFSTGGHYGSTVFDPMSRYRRLYITVCDDCLKRNKDRVRLVIETPRASMIESFPWEPFAEDSGT